MNARGILSSDLTTSQTEGTQDRLTAMFTRAGNKLALPLLTIVTTRGPVRTCNCALEHALTALGGKIVVRKLKWSKNTFKWTQIKDYRSDQAGSSSLPHSNQLQTLRSQSLLINGASHSHQTKQSYSATMNVAILEATQSDNTRAARTEVKKIEDHQLERIMEGIDEILEVVEKKKRTNYVIVASVGARHCILESQRDTIAAYAKDLEDIKKIERPHHQMIMCTTNYDCHQV